MYPPEGIMNKIGRMRVNKAMTFKKIYEELVGEYPDITVSWVHKWGKGLPLLKELEPNPDCEGEFRKIPPTHTKIHIRVETYKLLEQARERLMHDYKNTYLRMGLRPTDDDVIKDLLDKC